MHVINYAYSEKQGGFVMNVEEELRKINFVELSRAKEELLRKILLARKLRREFDQKLDLEDLDSVAAAKMEDKIK